jgi:NADH-quinone oxidoreductase subunit F
MQRPLTMHSLLRSSNASEPATSGSYDFQLVRQVVGKVDRRYLLDVVEQSGLAGCGGGSFPTGRKWRLYPEKSERPGARYFIVNADEMEPGTFKDRLLLEKETDLLIEGIILSAYILDANECYVFVRGEYHLAIERLAAGIKQAANAGILGVDILGSGFSLDIHVHRGAGRYICGEETALLNALEGRRPVPRAKPPYPQMSGLWGAPTIVNNVETVANIPNIVRNGADWYRSLGRHGGVGTKIFGVSGRVMFPGAYELPMGTTMRELVEQHAGGMQPGYTLRAILPGGASTAFLSAGQIDTPLTPSAMMQRGTRLGTGTAIILDDRTCPVGFIANLQRFFARESCGFCTPCRDGLPWVSQILDRIEAGKGRRQDLDRLQDIQTTLNAGNTFCALAPGAMASLQSGLSLFRDDFVRHIERGACPWK